MLKEYLKQAYGCNEPVFISENFSKKKAENLINQGFRHCLLAFLSGFEPLAFRLGGGRSILLSYRNAYKIVKGETLNKGSFINGWYNHLTKEIQ